MADKILDLQFDSATLIYNHFISVIAYKTAQKELPGFPVVIKNRDNFDTYEFEDGDKESGLKVNKQKKSFPFLKTQYCLGST